MYLSQQKSLQVFEPEGSLTGRYLMAVSLVKYYLNNRIRQI